MDSKPSGLLRISNWKFENKLSLMALVLALVPLATYALFSLNNFRENSIASAMRDLEGAVRSISLLCEAQEALDRLTRGPTGLADDISRASPYWKDGDQFKSLHTIIKGTTVVETGYVYVMDSSGLLVIHPTLEGQNLFKIDDSISGSLKSLRDTALKMQIGETDTATYLWTNSPGEKPRLKRAVYTYFQPYDWIIVAAAYEDEILAPYYQGRGVFIIMLLGTAVVVVVLVLIFSKLIMRPVRQLTKASTRIAQGDFDVQLPVGSRDEIGIMAESFRVMVDKLRKAHDDLLGWSKTLEQKVAERTAELKKAHDRMLVVEKMSSLGQLSAMVAHEINNPLSGILSYLKLSMKLLAKEPFDRSNIESINKFLGTSSSEVKRCGEIVRNLLMFSRRSFGEFGEDHLNQIAEKSIALVKHSLEMQGMTLEKRFDEGRSDLIYCDASGLQQMFISLMVNAIDAMDKGGKLIVQTDCGDENTAEIRVVDTGKGIPESVLPHIFEPFFTSKESKRSIGMGLAVVYGIVQSHEGSIKVNSKVGEGTEFIIRISRRPSPQASMREKSALPDRAVNEMGDG